MARPLNSESPGKFKLLAGLFVPWVFGTALAAFLGWLIVIGILSRIPGVWMQSERSDGVVLWGGLGIIYGTLIGLAQWVTLRYWLEHARRWIAATALGEGVYWIVSFVPGANITSIGRGSLIGAFAGLALGAAQWIVLRRKLRHAWVWVVVTVIGSVLGEVVTQSIPPGGHPSVQFAIGPILTSAVIGVATAMLAVMLFSRPKLKSA